MDAYFDIVSLRAVREYSDRPIPQEALHRILQAGRAAGSSRNTQPWQFYVVRTRDLLDKVAATVFAPDNLRGCQAAIAVVTSGKGTFDAGRCAQNMMLAAWADGIGSSPNGVKEPESLSSILGLTDGQSVVTILSLGYPTQPARTSGDADAVLQRINRKPLEDLVVWKDE